MEQKLADSKKTIRELETKVDKCRSEYYRLKQEKQEKEASLFFEEWAIHVRGLNEERTNYNWHVIKYFCGPLLGKVIVSSS